MPSEQLLKTSSPASPPGTVGYAVLTYTAREALAIARPTGSARADSSSSSAAMDSPGPVTRVLTPSDAEFAAVEDLGAGFGAILPHTAVRSAAPG
jgi:hypothetical protein